MKITPEEVHVLAADARLKITDAEMPEIVQYLGAFLDEIEKMNSKNIDLEGVPLFDFAEAVSCPLREDTPEKYPHRDDILASASERDGDYYRTARILED